MGLWLFLSAILILLLGVINTGLAELFSSMATMESLSGTELEVLILLQTYRNREMEKINAAKEYVKALRSDFTKPVQTAVARAKTFLTHPSIAVPFIRHHTVKWGMFKNDASSNELLELNGELEFLRGYHKFPTTGDVEGAAVALGRLQTTYKITADEVAYGQVPNLRVTPLFTSNEAFLVGQHLLDNNYYGSAMQWLKTALEIYYTEEEKTEDYAVILDWLTLAGFMYDGNASKALELTYEIQEYDPLYENLDVKLKDYTEYLRNMTDEERTKMAQPEEPYKDLAEDGTYEALCRGELQVAANVLSYLRCYYETHNNPYLLLQPLKFEVAHVDPDVYMIHDVLKNDTMEQIKIVTLSSLIRATVVEKENASTINGTISATRVSKAQFFPDGFDPAVGVASQLAGVAANLNPFQAEPLQVNNYGMGGHYLPHLDYFNDPLKIGTYLIEPLLGDRIATFMYYFSDVEAGGATVFPKINVTLFPEKGSAAFWFNLHKDGDGDVRTEHAGCPVLAGNKWVANKWFRMAGQDLTRPCELKKDSPDTPKEISISLPVETVMTE